MGQGTLTGLAQLVAEELECDWSKVTTQGVTPGENLASKRAWGEMGTGGSRGIRTSQDYVRRGGAAARMMLLQAAADQWQVPVAELSVADGVITHAASKRSTSYGKVAAAAALLTAPDPKSIKLKDPKVWKIAGKPMKRLDTADKLNGSKVYAIDLTLPGMLCAAIKDCPVFGGKLESYDEAKIAGRPGVHRVVKVKDTAVAVVADTWWRAKAALEALPIVWDEGPNASQSSALIAEHVKEGLTASTTNGDWHKGDAVKAIESAAKKVEAVYSTPFLAHATMEPMNCTAHFRDGECELWVPTQVPGAAAESVASALGIPRERVKVHVTFIGGGFGRRLIQDYAVEAALLSRDAGPPVQVVWSREDDIRHDFYRPAAVHVLQAGLDAQGQLISWRHRGSSPSIETFYNGTGISPQAAAQVDSLDFPALLIPNFRLEFAVAESGMPLGYWRSVDASGNQFVLSSFFDEAAHAAGGDPLEFLLAAFGPARKIPVGNGETLDVGRRRGVIELAAEKSNWHQPLPAGRGRGIAAAFGWGSYVAQVAEVTCDANKGTLRVDRVVCVIDCGLAVNPLSVKAQMESAINFGLAQTLKSAITVSGGKVEQSNFHDYEVLRLNDAPPIIEVHIVPSTEPPGGCGEPGVPPVAPAVANAIFAATGKRLRRLPIRAADLRST
jgi:isoquinoline 1-oxidoreductase subunit beta